MASGTAAAGAGKERLVGGQSLGNDALRALATEFAEDLAARAASCSATWSGWRRCWWTGSAWCRADRGASPVRHGRSGAAHARTVDGAGEGGVGHCACIVLDGRAAGPPGDGARATRWGECARGWLSLMRRVSCAARRRLDARCRRVPLRFNEAGPARGRKPGEPQAAVGITPPPVLASAPARCPVAKPPQVDGHVCRARPTRLPADCTPSYGAETPRPTPDRQPRGRILPDSLQPSQGATGPYTVRRPTP